MATVTLELDDEIYTDFAESVGAASDDPALVLQLVREGLVRHIMDAGGRVRKNRLLSKANEDADRAEAALRERVTGQKIDSNDPDIPSHLRQR